jgi:hypothetical protein
MYSKEGKWGYSVEALLAHFNELTPKLCKFTVIQKFIYFYFL